MNNPDKFSLEFFSWNNRFLEKRGKLLFKVLISFLLILKRDRLNIFYLLIFERGSYFGYCQVFYLGAAEKLKFYC